MSHWGTFCARLGGDRIAALVRRRRTGAGIGVLTGIALVALVALSASAALGLWWAARTHIIPVQAAGLSAHLLIERDVSGPHRAEFHHGGTGHPRTRSHGEPAVGPDVRSSRCRPEARRRIDEQRDRYACKNRSVRP